MTCGYTSVANPRYVNPSNTAILCTVQFAHIAGPVPFIATNDDPEPHGKQIFADCVAGKYGPVGAYVAPSAPPPTAEPKAP